MKDRQWGSLFFSILDTRKVINLVLDLFNIVQNNLQPPTPGAPPCPGRVQPDLHQLSGARLCHCHHQVRWPQRGAVPTTTGSQDSFLLASVFFQGGRGAAEECFCQGPLLSFTWWGSSAWGAAERQSRRRYIVKDENEVQHVHWRGHNYEHTNLSHSVSWIKF